jgi:F-type H+-transporting ATPase subunit alpha
MNAGISVSRVGGNAQIKAMKALAGGLRVTLAQYREVEAFSQFGSDLDRATQEQLADGQRLTMVLRQAQYEPLAVESQILQIYAATPQEGRSSWVRKVPVEDVPRYAAELSAYFQKNHPEILQDIRSTGVLSDENRAKLDGALDAFADVFQPSREKG